MTKTKDTEPKRCENCRWWDIWSDDWGECKKKIDGTWTNYKVETHTEVQKYEGEVEVRSEIEEVTTDKRFYCAYHEPKETSDDN